MLQTYLNGCTEQEAIGFTQGKVWFTAEAAKCIGSDDPLAAKVDWIMGTGQDRTHMIFVSPDAKRILTTNVSSATVTILDKSEGAAGMPPGPPPGEHSPRRAPAGGGPPRGARGGDWLETVIPVGRGAEGFDVSPDGKEAWIANAGDGTVSVIDMASKRVSATGEADGRGANRLKFTPDGKQVFVTAGPAVVIMDAATKKETKRLTAVHGSGGIQMQPDGARAYVACGRAGFIAVIDLKSFETVGQIEVGEPDGLAWAAQP
jgi:DNA-binding beta-propeller fold protein YncE